MSAVDRNKIFFGLMHYILSEQNNVDWILKTSLVNFTGINSTISDQQYEKKPLSDDIIDYIHQVKPYHVQFEQFIEKYSNKQDYANVLSEDISDIEMDIRFDAITSEVDEQGNMSSYDYMNTHAANRLWYCKKDDYNGNEDELKEYIKDVLNCHFKGITVDGRDFNIDKFGYDVFLYDEKLYDSPTVTAEYYMIDMKEDDSAIYKKEYIGIGISTFMLNVNSETSITVSVNGHNKEYDYNISNGILTIHDYHTSIKDKVVIECVHNGIITRNYYICTSFTEYEGDTNIYRFQDISNDVFRVPDNQYGRRRMVVNIQKPNGSRFPTQNYEYVNDGIRILESLDEHSRVFITVVDFGELYDKIYTYEDCYGQSNNLISLDGNEFLRPYYESNRPSELIVTYPINNLKVFEVEEKNNNSVMKSVIEMDNMGNNTKVALSKTLKTRLVKDFKIGDRIIYLEDISKLKKPYISQDNLKMPGKILIGSEIIEFYEYSDKDNTLFSIRRGANGSNISEEYVTDEVVYCYNDDSKKVYNYICPTIETMCDGNTNEYKIPEKYTVSDKVIVMKRTHIQLLTDITIDGESFIISSNKIDMPNGNKRGVIYIDNDKIFYDNIEEIMYNKKPSYKISGYTCSKNYNADKSIIYSSIPEVISEEEYDIIVPKLADGTDDLMNTFIRMKMTPKIGEVIQVLNEYL